MTADVTEFATGEPNVIVIKGETDAQITRRRQQHRNVFAERCRLSNKRPPDNDTMTAWWPGTKATFA